MERLLLLVIGAFSGIALSLVFQVSAQGENGAATKPVYVVVSAEIHEPDQLGPYAEAARPLALAAGLEVLARVPAVPEENVFEGTWPHAGGITIEKFESMQAFRDFWNSDDYQAAIELRKGKVDLNFVVALEAN